MSQADRWIHELQLRPHPEGGYFRETYRSNEIIAAEHLPLRFGGDRAFSTAIYFLLKDGDFSALHRIKQDEVWHHYAGGPLVIDVLSSNGRHTSILLGNNSDRGERPQAVVKAGELFAASLGTANGYALAGCTVAPGFDFADFTMPEREALLQEFPQHRKLVMRLTRARA